MKGEKKVRGLLVKLTEYNSPSFKIESRDYMVEFGGSYSPLVITSTAGVHQIISRYGHGYGPEVTRHIFRIVDSIVTEIISRIDRIYARYAVKISDEASIELLNGKSGLDLLSLAIRDIEAKISNYINEEYSGKLPISTETLSIIDSTDYRLYKSGDKPWFLYFRRPDPYVVAHLNEIIDTLLDKLAEISDNYMKEKEKR